MRKQLLYLISFIAVILFFQLNYGLRIVNPTNVSWLMTIKTDWNTHYLGWMFYRNEPWRFPLGQVTGYFYPLGTNVGFTDSIPLLAIFFKLFSPLLPVDFQYFGGWLLVCHLLIAYFTIRLCELFSMKPFVIFLTVLFITQNPVLIYRAMHPALCSHWLLLASFYLYFLDPAKVRAVSILRRQFVLLVLSALITPYMLAAEFGFTIVIVLKLLLYDRTIGRKSVLIYLSGCVVSVLAIWLAIGMISVGKKETLEVDGGFGALSMNLNAFFDPWGWSSFLPPLKRVSMLQYEGFMYLGMGIFLLLAVLIVSRSGMAIRKKHLPLLIYLILLGLFAITNIVSFNDKILFTYPLPHFIITLGNIFRASGRFFWAPYYAILFYILFSVAGSGLRGWLKTSLLSVALLVQLYDIKFLLTFQHPSYGAYTPPIDKKWQELMTHFDRVLLYPPFGTDYREREDYQYFCYLAALDKKPVDAGYVARSDGRGMKAFSDSMEHHLYQGSIDPGALYITTGEYLQHFGVALQSGKLVLNSLDGYYYMYDGATTDKRLLAMVDTLNGRNRRQRDSVYAALVDKRAEFLPAAGIGVSEERVSYATGQFIEGDNYIYWTGWAFIKGKQNNKGDSIFAYLVSDKRSYIARMTIHSSPDVTAAFKAVDLNDAGFECGIFETAVEKGKYAVGIAIKESDGKWSYRLTGQEIKIYPSEQAPPGGETK